MKIADDVIVRVLPLPMCVEGLISDTPDGYHNIYINSNYSKEMQEKFLRHELAHLENNDFYNTIPIHQAEENAKKRK